MVTVMVSPAWTAVWLPSSPSTAETSGLAVMRVLPSGVHRTTKSFSPFGVGPVKEHCQTLSGRRAWIPCPQDRMRARWSQRWNSSSLSAAGVGTPPSGWSCSW